jgi:hypothetical protein
MARMCHPIIILALLVFTVSSQPTIGFRFEIAHDPDVDIARLNGKVKSMEEKKCDFKEKRGKIIEECEKTISSFDTAGRIVEIIEYEEDGKQSCRKTFEYNKFGKLELESAYGRKDEPDWSVKIKYDGNQRLSEQIHCGSDGTMQFKYTDFKYDGKGNCIEKVKIDDDGDRELYQTKYTYCDSVSTPGKRP